MKTKLALSLLSTLCFQLSLLAQGTAFTYQGKLTDGPNPASGSYDLRCTLYDSSGGPTVVAGPLTNAATLVSAGLFTVALDFGPGIFTGPARWLEIGVRTNGAGAFTTLSPRQETTPTPYALFAPNAGVAATAGLASTVAPGSVGTAALASGAVDSSRIAPGTITTTNLNPAVLSNTFWRLGGNTGTAPVTNFLGTSDNQPLEFKVYGQRVLRLEPNAATPNVIGGHGANVVSNGLWGGTIAGGGHSTDPNRVGGTYATVGGGVGNVSSGDNATVAGGFHNQSSGFNAAVGGGYYNLAAGNNAFVGGGAANTNSGDYGVLVGGQRNLVSSFHNTVGGGSNNFAGGPFATVPGGADNRAIGSYSFASGRRAKANQNGVFVWADWTDADFASTAANQFLLRASGGVGIGTNNPQSALHVVGTVTATSFSGSGANLTALNAANLTGTVAEPRLDAAIARDSEIFPAVLANDGAGSGLDADLLDGLHATAFASNSHLHAAAEIASGTLDNARLSTNVALRSAGNTFTGDQIIAGGSLGVGTNSPATALHVAGTITAEAYQGHWLAVTGAVQAMLPNRAYLAAHPLKVTLTLPAAPSVGDVVRVSGAGAGGWSIAQNAGQGIRIGHISCVLGWGSSWVARESTREWTTVSSSADGAKLIAAANHDYLYTSVDHGVTWARKPLAPDVYKDWTGVASSADGAKLVAVAAGDQIFTSVNSGGTWTARDISRNWTAVASSTDGVKLVATVDAGPIYTSTNSGALWTAQASGSRYWRAVASSDDGVKLVAADLGGRIYTSTNSGVSWTARASSANWLALASSSDGVCLVAGTGEGDVHVSTDSGVTWNALTNLTRSIRSLASSADGVRLVCVTEAGGIYTSTDSGVNWTARATARAWWGVASSADGTRLVAAVNRGQIYTSETTLVRPSATTTVGTGGGLEGAAGTAIELQYIGNNQFLPLSHEGMLFAY